MKEENRLMWLNQLKSSYSQTHYYKILRTFDFVCYIVNKNSNFNFLLKASVQSDSDNYN